MNNITLIGMAGSGKSTIGVLIAKILGMNFIDTDLMIQSGQQELLQDIINTKGIESFLNIEESTILNINVHDSIIATGGSVVYGELAMRKLSEISTIVYLSVPYEEIERRIDNITTRGIAMEKGKTLKDVFDERRPLYEKYADIVIDCSNKNIEANVKEIIKEISSNVLKD